MKTILVDAINGLIEENGSVFQEMFELLEKYPNPKITLTGANEEQFEKFRLSDCPYEVFSLKHDPEKSSPEYFKTMLEHYHLNPKEVVYFEHNIEAVNSAKSLGIPTLFYDHTKRNLSELKDFLDNNL